MSSCDGFSQNFESKMPENPTSAWNHNKPKQPVEPPSFTELFGELHFKESLESSTLPFLPSFSVPSASSSSLLLDLCSRPDITTDSENRRNLSFGSLLNAKESQEKSCVNKKGSYSTMNLESLHMCTEGLGFESFVDVEGSLDTGEMTDQESPKAKVNTLKHSSSEVSYSEYRRLRPFPAPIPSITRNGKSLVSYKSFRRDGRLVMKEVVNQGHGQEFIQACREDGRLTLHLVHRDEETPEDKEKAEHEE